MAFRIRFVLQVSDSSGSGDANQEDLASSMEILSPSVVLKVSASIDGNLDGSYTIQR